MALPDATMLAEKAKWDAAMAPLVDLNDTSKDFGYTPARTPPNYTPFNKWQLAYGFGSGPLTGVSLAVVAIGQMVTNGQILWSYAVADERAQQIQLPPALKVA